ncbi:MAG: formyl-CoA transferase [Rhodospirillaceae bacterium TMED8]|nr:formyl-CoA transferase [Magnetovibrio sp.]OUT48912.1 MAG: formyl-CoA transferase [Rhodospirillaceae bacterium TMED8]|tara:strand:+ start:722 stop:1909 length:1188 start_codon:yes stop_codon:yes gene_type:complete
MSNYNGPLSRFTILDLTRVRSGPTAVRHLADWGANVIKIEAPTAVDKSRGMGGARNGPDYQNIHRNKRSLSLNLKEEEGVEIFKKLLVDADVVVENYRPDVKGRLGIDYRSLKAINPKIILASISGFGQGGPYAQHPGFDQIAQGMGGLMSVTGLPGQGPVRVGIPIADLTAGNYTTIAILIGLLEREVSGEGQWVHTSLLEAMIAMLDFQAARWLIAGDVAPQAGNNHPTSIPTGVFKTKDGHINIAAAGDVMWDRLCDVLDAPDMHDHPNYATGRARSENRNSVNAQIEEYTVTKSSAEWIDVMTEAGVPCGPIYSIDEVFSDPQVEHVNMQHPVRHPVLGEMNLVGQAINFSRYKPKTGMPTPESGEHTDDILSELKFDADAIADLRARGII